MTKKEMLRQLIPFMVNSSRFTVENAMDVKNVSINTTITLPTNPTMENRNEPFQIEFISYPSEAYPYLCKIKLSPSHQLEAQCPTLSDLSEKIVDYLDGLDYFSKLGTAIKLAEKRGKQ